MTKLKKMSLSDLKKKANDIRKDILIMLEKAGSGHTGGSLGMADIFTALYFTILHHNPKNPRMQKRDLVFLSNGHICPVWYATLAHAGYFSKKELHSLRKINSLLQGHPHNETIPGVENSGGPLAQGISMAVGASMALKMDGKTNTVFALCGDGELNEGQVWEALLNANKFQLDNLIIIVDKNNIQLDGDTSDIMPMNHLPERFSSFGLSVVEIDGNNMREIISVLSKIKKTASGPTVVIAHTVPGKGVSFMENKYKWHGISPNKEELELALKELK